MTFEQLYLKVLKDKAQDKPLDLHDVPINENQLNCLLHPEEYPVICNANNCNCGEDKKCVAACMFNAIEIHDNNIKFNQEKCIGCSACIEACEKGNLTASRDTISVVDMLKTSNQPIYALVAPAFIGQFGTEATPGKLRTALLQLGFSGMIEVAAFADILTLKEALEFTQNETHYKDFQLTSCCCPVWIALIKKHFNDIVDHLPPSVSPMIACGRIIKEIYPNCKTVFIGPCMAKKAEAREKGLVGAIDLVLTFTELSEIFNAFDLDFSMLDETKKEHSSIAGRIYARSGGVSRAVTLSIKRINPKLDVKPVFANGVKECKTMLQNILDGEIKGNFYEGMGCIGGCVGGPKVLIPADEGTQFVDEYGESSRYRSPIDNPYVLELIDRLGFDSVEDFLYNSNILTRNF